MEISYLTYMDPERCSQHKCVYIMGINWLLNCLSLRSRLYGSKHKAWREGEVKEYDMGKACNTHEGEEECMQDCGWKTMRKETTRKT
jgi:hypothetical protein